jgi:hypothetical protein
LAIRYRFPGLHSHPVEGTPGILEADIDIQYRLAFERSGSMLILRNFDNCGGYLKNP